MGGGILNFKKWWSDDWHTIPRWARDLSGWLKGWGTTRVDLTVMTYDADSDMVHLDTTRVARQDLPAEALHVSNKGYKAFFVDQDDSGNWPVPGRATAHDMYLLLKSDALDVALEKRKTSILDMIDGKMLALIFCAILGVVVFYWWFL